MDMFYDRLSDVWVQGELTPKAETYKQEFNEDNFRKVIETL